jgi:PTH1 family peptidyl-tRNA hydrolase
MMVDIYCKINELVLDKKEFDGQFTKKDDFVIAQPLTNMNLSGSFVKKICNFYKIDVEDILVIYDDVSFEVGNIKLKLGGNSGGQNGINDIIEQLGTTQIKRVKIGIGKNDKNMLLGDYVLTDFSNEEMKRIEEAGVKVEKIIKEFIGNTPFEKIMSKWN